MKICIVTVKGEVRGAGFDRQTLVDEWNQTGESFDLTELDVKTPYTEMFVSIGDNGMLKNVAVPTWIAELNPSVHVLDYDAEPYMDNDDAALFEELRDAWEDGMNNKTLTMIY